MTTERQKRRRSIDRRKGVLTLNGLPFDLESSVAYNLGRPGNCYMAAYRIACSMAVARVDPRCFRIAQGVVACRSEESEWCGRRIMHAWCEWKVQRVWMAVDGSRPGHAVWLGLLDDYYQAAEVRAEDLWHYHLDEAVSLAARLGHFGPFRKPKVPADDWTADDERCLDKDGWYAD